MASLNGSIVIFAAAERAEAVAFLERLAFCATVQETRELTWQVLQLHHAAEQNSCLPDGRGWLV